MKPRGGETIIGNKLKEIGGYFSLENFEGEEYYNNLIAINSVRNGLAYIIESLKIKKIWLPFYLCDSIQGICEKYKLKCSFYEINDAFEPQIDLRNPLGKGEYIYVVNYYGQLRENCVRQYKEKYCNIILDNTQAFFVKPFDDIITLYNCRKFFGVPDGAYISGIPIMDKYLGIDISGSRMLHLLGRYEIGAAEFYKEYQNAEDQFDNMELLYMSKLTHNLLRAINYDSVKKKREENFSTLYSELKNCNCLKIELSSGPYMYPFMHPDAINIKKQLINNNVYVPTLWPEVIKKGESVHAMKLAANIIPLPVDQRYNREDMEIIIDIIKNICK